MSRAKKLLEGFKWNPNWGVKSGTIRKVRYPYGEGGVWYFKWKNMDMALLRSNINGGVWWVDDFFSTTVIIEYNDVKSNDSIVSIYGKAVSILNEMGIDKVREQIHGPKIVDKIEYLDEVLLKP